jgi:putative endopeptidase
MEKPSMRNLFRKSLASAVFAALSTTAIAATAPSFDVNDIDAKINPCGDFNGFVNAKWVAANPIPADRTRWGAFDQLREHSLQTQREIAEAAARDANKATTGSVGQ